MSPPSARPAPRSVGGGRWERLLPLLLVPVALLSDLAAGLPTRTYFFRDFTATFYPLRLFAARELRDGRFASWNPFIFEGSFQLPALYPPDLLLALWPTPAVVSWVLTLHLPVAALGAWWLARELGASRGGALAAGAGYALGGMTLSSLNLYVFLQALALAPFVAGTLRRSALRSGRAVATAAVLVALALSTLAVEFVGQAVVLGLALSLAARPSWRGAARPILAVALGAGLAAVPLALTLGLLPETPRGSGFDSAVRLGHAVHPAVLLQTLLPDLFGVPRAPAEAWWGGHFFTRGLPYFLTLYVGPVLLCLAALGVSRLRRRERAVLLVLGALGLWYALGPWGGLAPLVSDLPLARSFRFPSKALLLPWLGVAIAAGFGADRLRYSPRAWTRLAVTLAAIAAAVVGLVAFLAAAPASVVGWTGVRPGFWPSLVAVQGRDAAFTVALAALVGAAALGVGRGWIGTGMATALVVALAAADLARAGAGLNPQVSESFFDPLPELEAQRLNALDGGRVFSYGLDHSPSFLEYLERGGAGVTFTGTWISRQMLSPYSNVVDRVEVPEATDLTSFVPRPRELGPGDYDPASVARLVPWLRNAAVTRVLSLDPLESDDLRLLDTVPTGPPGLAIRVYGLARAWPRVYVACRVAVVPGIDAARGFPYSPGFRPGADVALTAGPAATCRSGTARRVSSVPGAERYVVDADGAGYLVVRESFARGWRASVDGTATPVLRANGKHRAVPVPAGRHEVDLRYVPPGLGWGLGLCLLSAGAVAGVWLSGERWPMIGRPPGARPRGEDREAGER